MAVPASDIFLIGKMRLNLEPLSYTDTEEAKRQRARTRHTLETFGPVTVWAPSRATLVEKGHLTKMKCEAARSRRFYSCFEKRRCVLSDASIRVITEFGLHNAGGSDLGMTSAISATLMAASIEMGKPLSPKQLRFGSPSESLLSLWERGMPLNA